MSRFPDSVAARETGRTLADTTAKAAAETKQRRLGRLWTYQSGNESGGEQSTASMYSDPDASGDRVRLVLRRHSAWGESAYLFSAGKGLVCRRTCLLAVRFDDQPTQQIKAYRPPTGEPALFIADDKEFVAKLEKAGRIQIEVVEAGGGKRTLTFDVGGFDAEKFLPLTRKK